MNRRNIIIQNFYTNADKLTLSQSTVLNLLIFSPHYLIYLIKKTYKPQNIAEKNSLMNFQ